MMVMVLTKLDDGSLYLELPGEPVSMKNSRQIASRKGRKAIIKSDEAIAYETDIKRMVPLLTPMLDCPLKVDMKLFYKDARRDLDEHLILDALQGRIYKNDRQVIEKHVERVIDRNNPRCTMIVTPRAPQRRF